MCYIQIIIQEQLTKGISKADDKYQSEFLLKCISKELKCIHMQLSINQNNRMVEFINQSVSQILLFIHSSFLHSLIHMFLTQFAPFIFTQETLSQSYDTFRFTNASVNNNGNFSHQSCENLSSSIYQSLCIPENTSHSYIDPKNAPKICYASHLYLPNVSLKYLMNTLLVN